MSMTREEAITQLEILLEYCESMMTSEYPVWRRDCEALQMLIAAIRPVSREQVERMFPGCEKCKSVCHRCLNYPVALYPKTCRTCVEHSNYESASNFCEDCGKPLTDEAVQMVMERLEALKDAGD